MRPLLLFVAYVAVGGLKPGCSRAALGRRRALLAGAASTILAPSVVVAAAEPTTHAHVAPAPDATVGLLYDTRRGQSMPASPSFLSALLDKAVLGTAANLNTRGVVCVAERHDCAAQRACSARRGAAAVPREFTGFDRSNDSSAAEHPTQT